MADGVTETGLLVPYPEPCACDHDCRHHSSDDDGALAAFLGTDGSRGAGGRFGVLRGFRGVRIARMVFLRGDFIDARAITSLLSAEQRDGLVKHGNRFVLVFAFARWVVSDLLAGALG